MNNVKNELKTDDEIEELFIEISNIIAPYFEKQITIPLNILNDCIAKFNIITQHYHLYQHMDGFKDCYTHIFQSLSIAKHCHSEEQDYSLIEEI